MRKTCALALCVALAASGCVIYTNVDLTTRKSPYEEIVLQEAESFWTGEKVAVIDIHGLLTKRYDKGSGLLSPAAPDPVSDLKEALDRARADSDVRAVVLRIDSPGGLVVWCDAMYQEIEAFRKETGKPVVACITGLGASGGYYLALAADEICAAPTATVGSIGVIAVFLNLRELSRKIGLEAQVVKSGPKKDMGALWRGLSAEETEVMQRMIDEYYARFVDLILAQRSNLKRSTLLPLADGRLLTAQQALKARLIDRVAYPQEAVLRARTLAGLTDAHVVTYARAPRYVNNIYSGRPPLTVVNLDLAPLKAALSPGFYYMWCPGL